MNQVKSTHHNIDHFGSVKYAELVDPMEENGNSKQSCTYCCCFVLQIHFFICDTTCRSYYSKSHSMTLLWDRLCLLQQNSITVQAVKAYS